MKTKDNIPEGNPFRVPENYFEEVNKRILSSTTGSDSREKQRSIRIPLRQYLTIAASVAVLAILSYTGSKLFSPVRESLSLNGIPSETYSEELVNNIDLILLEENAVSIDIPELSTSLDNQTIVDYLIQENIDIDDI